MTSPAPGGWASVTAGEFQACATRTGGALWCWGANIAGELGIGNDTDQDLPQQVTSPAPGGWADATSGDEQTCATRTGGTLWCWGANLYGQLGIGNQTDQDRPRQVTGCAQPEIQARRARTPAPARTTATATAQCDRRVWPHGPPGHPAVRGVTRPAWWAKNTSCARSRAPSLIIARLTWVLAVAELSTRASAISSVDQAAGDSG